MKYITRVDREYHHCWRVSICPKQKWGARKSFFDQKYHGKYNALKQAKQWRDKQVKLLKKHILTLMWSRGKGYHEEWVTKENGISYLYISTQFAHNKIIKRKKFSVNKYGYDEAVRLAKTWRKEQVMNLKELF